MESILERKRKIWASRENMLHIIRDIRGFIKPVEYENYIDYEDFLDKIEGLEEYEYKNLIQLHFTDKDEINAIKVIWTVEPKLGNGVQGKICENLSENNITNAYVITEQGLTSTAKNALTSFSKQGYKIHILTLHQSMINIFDHELVPKQEICSKKEAKDIKKKYAIKDKRNWPRMLSNDPAAIYLGARSGDIIKITKKSITTEGYEISYRIVS